MESKFRPGDKVRFTDEGLSMSQDFTNRYGLTCDTIGEVLADPLVTSSGVKVQEQVYVLFPTSRGPRKWNILREDLELYEEEDLSEARIDKELESVRDQIQKRNQLFSEVAASILKLKEEERRLVEVRHAYQIVKSFLEGKHD